MAPGQLSLRVWSLINAFLILSDLSGIAVSGRMIVGAYELEVISAGFRHFELRLCTGRNLQLVCRIGWTCPRRKEPISSLGARSLTVPSDFGLLMVHYSHIVLCVWFLNRFPSSHYLFPLFLGFISSATNEQTCFPAILFSLPPALRSTRFLHYYDTINASSLVCGSPSGSSFPGQTLILETRHFYFCLLTHFSHLLFGGAFSSC